MTENQNAPQTGNPGTNPPPPPAYQVPPQQTYAQQPQGQSKSRSRGFGSMEKQKWPAVVLAFTLGLFGLHKFYLGYKNEGLAMLLISLIGSLCVGLGPTVMLVFALIEAVKYVSLTEADFEATYVRGYKGWF